MKRTIAKILACSAIFSFMLMSFECGEDRYYKNEYLINNDTDTYVELRLTKRDKTEPSDTLVIDAFSSVVFKSFENGTDPKFEKLAYILLQYDSVMLFAGNNTYATIWNDYPGYMPDSTHNFFNINSWIEMPVEETEWQTTFGRIFHINNNDL
ncbi:MAG: hypothetical protein IJQ89_07410 [Bacteroidales bacterium]|nr:hypothetical protein [Bacteroidales bacterium]